MPQFVVRSEGATACAVASAEVLRNEPRVLASVAPWSLLTSVRATHERGCGTNWGQWPERSQEGLRPLSPSGLRAPTVEMVARHLGSRE